MLETEGEGTGAPKLDSNPVSPGCKKLKQARLPFAPLNKTPQQTECMKKRKLSEDPETPEPKKQVKMATEEKSTTDDKAADKITTTKVEVATEAEKKSDADKSADERAVAETKKVEEFQDKTEEKENVSKPSEVKTREIKPKKAKKTIPEVVMIDEESLQERPDVMKGRVKLPFKKKERKSAEQKENDSDVEILEEIDIHPGAKEKDHKKSEETAEKSVKPVTDKSMKPVTDKSGKVDDKSVNGGAINIVRDEDKSMTDEWAEFHQKEMEKNPVEVPIRAIEKLVTPKADKKKGLVKPSLVKSSEKTKPKESENKEAKTDAPKPSPKANPLAKFLVKMAPGKIPPKKEAPVKESKKEDNTETEIVEEKKNDTAEVKNTADIEIIESMDVDVQSTSDSTTKDHESMAVDSPTPSTSDNTTKDQVADSVKTPTVTKTAAKTSAVDKTPLNKVESVAKTPTVAKVMTPVNNTPANVRAKQMAVTKLKVAVQELIIKMEEAVEKADFLQAHEMKQKITSMEAEIEKIQADKEFIAYSPTTQGILTSVSNATPTPGQTAPAAMKTPTTNTAAESIVAGDVSTPSGASDQNLTPKSSQTKKPKVKKVTTPGCETTPNGTAKAPTPKQLAHRARLAEEKRKKNEALEEEKEKKRKERELAKQDKERQKEIDQRMKEIEKMDKERQRREKEREKEKERVKLEEEKQKKREEKELELKRKEEEKAKAEEAKRKLEEQEAEKKKKAAEAFKGFFVKKEAVKAPEETKEEKIETENKAENHQFNPFQVKNNMKIAPMVRADTTLAKNSLDSLEGVCGPADLYLETLKAGKHMPGRQGKTWPWTKAEEDDEVEILEDEEMSIEDLEAQGEDGAMILLTEEGKQHRAKLLQFHDNQRPAYWGTWRKKSKHVTGRRPFSQDPVVFDYEYDSDEDWEDEGEGESLSDAEDEKEEEDEYEVDNEFFVPHGYLSDGEEDKDDDEVFNPEMEKEKLKVKAKEFEKEIKKKTQQLKPRLWGCYWESAEVDTETAAIQLVKVLSNYAAIPCCNNNLPIPTSISHPNMSPVIQQGEEVSESSKIKIKAKVPKVFPEEALPDLVKLTHLNVNSKMFLAKEFIQFWCSKTLDNTQGETDNNSDTVSRSVENTPSTSANASAPGSATPSTGTMISKKKVLVKIQEIADYKLVDGKKGRFWVVKPEILEQVKHEDKETNNWNYILEQPNNNYQADTTPGSAANSKPNSRPQSPIQSKSTSLNPSQLITKFTKVLSEDERAKLNTTPPSKKPKVNKAPSQNSGVAVPGPSGMVNMIQIKKAPTTNPSANPGVNKIAIKRKANVQQMAPSSQNGVNMIPIKRAATANNGDSAPPAKKSANAAKLSFVNAIPVKKSPGGVAIQKPLKVATIATKKASTIAIKKAPGNGSAAGSKSGLPGNLNLPGVSITKIASTVNDEDCITLD